MEVRSVPPQAESPHICYGGACNVSLSDLVSTLFGDLAISTSKKN